MSGSSGVVAVLEVGAQEALVAVLRGAGVELLQPLGQAAEELRVGGHVAGRRHRLLVPLDEPHRVGQRPVLLGGGRGGEEEDLGLHVLRIDARRLPDVGRLGQEDVLDDQPVELLHRRAGELGVGTAHGRVLAVGEEALDDAVVHVDEDVLVAVRVGLRPLGNPLVAEVVVLGGGVAVEGLEQAHEELRLVDPVPALRASPSRGRS